VRNYYEAFEGYYRSLRIKKARRRVVRITRSRKATNIAMVIKNARRNITLNWMSNKYKYGVWVNCIRLAQGRDC
jgi:hypothetical protein